MSAESGAGDPGAEVPGASEPGGPEPGGSEPGGSGPGGSEPGGLAYASLLGATTIGALSGNIINAPLHRIQQDFSATDSQIVLAVAAFTISMVIFVPLTGWLSDRYGSVRVIVIGLAIMAVAQLLATFSVSLEMLILMRVIQGAACSAFPPAVQRALAALWPSKGSKAMAAWASAIGVGQAVGPPVGGLISEFVGWRGVFVVQSALCVALLVTIVIAVPKAAGRPAPIHGVGMAVLMIAMGAAVLTVTLIGQRADPVTEIIVGIVASAGLVIYAFLAARHPEKLFAPRSLLEKRYVRGTLVASTTMLIMGVCLVSLPLYLGDSLGLTPGPVGLVVFAMAFAMTISGGLTSWLSDRFSSRMAMELGLVVLVIAPLALGWWTAEQRAGVLVQALGVVVLLLVMGAAINAGQSVAAFAISRSPAARNSMAFGVHNTARFMGMAVGYAWAALVVPMGVPLLLYGGAAAVALVALLVTVIGGPAPAIGSGARAR